MNPNQAANVLLVDADAGFVRWAGDLLSRAGHRFVHAESAAVAVERLRAQTFDLALVGLRLPDMGGIEALERIKAAAPETPVAIVAEQPQVDVAIAALRKGAYDFLRKPVAEDDVLALAEKSAQIRQMGYERRARRKSCSPKRSRTSSCAAISRASTPSGRSWGRARR